MADRGLNLTRTCIDPLRGKDTGFYSFLFDRMYAGCESPHIVTMESLREELATALPALGRNLDDAERAFFADAPATNTTDHAHYTDYYSDELRELVARKDAGIIRRFDYSFG